MGPVTSPLLWTLFCDSSSRMIFPVIDTFSLTDMTPVYSKQFDWLEANSDRDHKSDIKRTN